MIFPVRLTEGTSNGECGRLRVQVDLAEVNQLTAMEKHPNDGEDMITSHLLQGVICVPELHVCIIHRVNPEGVAERNSKADVHFS